MAVSHCALRRSSSFLFPRGFLSLPQRLRSVTLDLLVRRTSSGAESFVFISHRRLTGIRSAGCLVWLSALQNSLKLGPVARKKLTSPPSIHQLRTLKATQTS